MNCFCVSNYLKMRKQTSNKNFLPIGQVGDNFIHIIIITNKKMLRYTHKNTDFSTAEIERNGSSELRSGSG